MAVVKFLALSLMVSPSSSQQFLPVKGLKEGLRGDPADALAHTLLKTVGLDSEENKISNYNSPAAVSSKVVTVGAGRSGAPHTRLSSRDIMGVRPEIATDSLPSPKEWSAPPPSLRKSDNSALSSLKDGMKHMFQDMAPRSKSVADWSEFRDDASSESSREVVKVFDRDAVIRQPVQQQALHVSTPDDESSVPAYMNKLRQGPSAGSRWFKQPVKAAMHVESRTKTVHQENATELEAKFDRMQEEAEGTDSLAKSLVGQLKSEKKKEVARMQRPHLPTGEVTKEAVPESSALDSAHKGHKSAKRMLPVRPEDVQNATLPFDEMPEATPVLKLPEKKNVPVDSATPSWWTPPVRSEGKKLATEKHSHQKSPMHDLFGMYATEGHVDSKNMEAVLEAQGIKNNWNWKVFDKDGDGKLSEKEFANAMIVAQRFKTRKN